MDEKQSAQDSNDKKSKDSKLSGRHESLPPQPKSDSPMDKFNNALRKILSVPKNDIKKK